MGKVYNALPMYDKSKISLKNESAIISVYSPHPIKKIMKKRIR